MKKLIYFLIGSLLFVSCKLKDEKEEVEAVQPQAEYGFKVTARVISKTTDDFCLHFTEDGSINFGENMVWMPVPGNQELQNVDFFLPEEAYPTELRLDLGLKQTAEDTIYLKSLNFDYNGKKLDIVGQQLGQYFRADENHCTFDPVSGAIIPIVKNGKVQHPVLYPHEVELGKALKNLANTN